MEKVMEDLLSKIIPQELPELNTHVFDAEATLPQHVLTSCNTLPFMGSRRVVQVKRFHRYSTGEQRSFLSYLLSPCPTTTLILTAEKLDAELKKKVKEGIFVLELPRNAAPYWIRKMAREYSKEISADAVEALNEAVGEDLQILHNEISKLALYVGDVTRIDVQDVRDVVSNLRIATIFDLTKAIGERNLNEAMRALDTLWETGETYLRIMGMIARQFRQLIITKELVGNDGPPSDARTRLGNITPRVFKELRAQAETFSLETLRRSLLILWRTDLRLKTSGLPRRTILEHALMELCSSESR